MCYLCSIHSMNMFELYNELFTQWEKNLRKNSSQVGMDRKKVQKEGRDEKNSKNTTLLQNDGGPLFGLQLNALTSLVHLLFTQQSELGMQVHCIWGQRGSHHHSVVGQCCWVFLIPALFLRILQVPPYLKWTFFRNFYPSITVWLKTWPISYAVSTITYIFVLLHNTLLYMYTLFIIYTTMHGPYTVMLWP